MHVEAITHTFFDIEIEHLDESAENRLIKILAVDGRRFTYHLRGPLSDGAVEFIKECMDRVYFSDLLIEHDGTEFTCRESPVRLKKHG